jgi:hypothetical protein
MAPKKLEKGQWQEFFDRVSKVLDGKQAEIEIASLSLGDQVQATWLPLLGLVYDHKNDLVEVALEGLDHMIRKPRDVYVDIGVGELVAVEIEDAEGTKQIIRLRDPLMLPPPRG